MSEGEICCPFIPAWLDDLCLSANQFRVICHLWRRGVTFSNAGTIAKMCRLKRDTVFEILSELEARGLIRRTPRPGQTTLIEPVPFGATGSNGNPSRLGGQVEANPSRFGGQDPPRFGGLDPSRFRGQDPSRFGGHKGTPSKVPPIRSFSLPADSDSRDEKADGKPSAIVDQIYQSYPLKVGRVAALKAITKAMKAKDPQWLLERVEAYAKAIAWQERQYIPHPATWFNGGRYDDDPENWKDPKAQTSKPRPALAITHGRRGHEETL